MRGLGGRAVDVLDVDSQPEFEEELDLSTSEQDSPTSAQHTQFSSEHQPFRRPPHAASTVDTLKQRSAPRSRRASHGSGVVVPIELTVVVCWHVCVARLRW